MAGDLSDVFPNQMDGRRTMHEYVYSTVRKAILDGQLTGGTRLVQADIASTMGVSTTPVREALRDLASILGLRSILEPEAIRRAWPKITDQLVDEVEAIHHRIGAATSTSDFVALNGRFHGLVFDQAEAPRLLAILESLTAPWVMYVSAALNQDEQHRERAARGHSEILDALRERDLDAVINATVDHLSITHQTLEAALAASRPTPA